MTASVAAIHVPRPCAVPRRMTRCECADLPFDELRRRMQAEGASLHEACRSTGCGQLCSACLPDLEAFLAGRD